MRALSAALPLALLGCREVTDPGPRPIDRALVGAVTKGPFLRGSSVSVSALDAAGAPTGVVVLTETTDDAGRFEARLDPAPSGVRLEAEGYHWNEATGALSGGTLTLRALSPSSAESTLASVNLLTHVSALRAEALLAEGLPLAEAVPAAEAEAVAALRIAPPGFAPDRPGVALDLLHGDDDASAFLFALGTVVTTAAVDRAGPGGPIDATLTELVNGLAADLADGALDGGPAVPTGEDFAALQATIDADAAMARLADRFAEIGVASEVPDLHRVFDRDRDGLADRDDPDADGDGHPGDADCDDLDPAVFPGAPEDPADGPDRDCTDDTDGDGARSPEAGGDDCDDLDPAAFPGAPEVWYDGVDQACDGGDDFDQDGDGAVPPADCDDLHDVAYRGADEIWYDGLDGDCRGGDDFDQDGDWVPVGEDCDDEEPAARPGSVEVWYDGLDGDCLGGDDFDQDGDGAPRLADCDDTDPLVHPGAPEVWYDGVDGDCDRGGDFDRDGDGAPLPADCDDADPTRVAGCAAPDADHDGAPAAIDCDDADPRVRPDAAEVWYDGVDADCDGADDFDADGDGTPVPADCDDADPAGPAGPDLDGDGVPDACDACPVDPDPTQADADADGWADACAVFPTSAERVGAHDGAWFGAGRALADVDGDGHADLVVGEARRRDAAGAEAGAVHVYPGGPDGLAAEPATTVAIATPDLFGWRVVALGDVNGDGFGDVGIDRWVFLGSPDGLPPTPAWEVQAGAVDAAGDVNGDGFDDAITGDITDPTQSGTAAVWLGGPGGLATTPAWSVTGQPMDRLGVAAIGAGDVDGDGYDDVLVGTNGVRVSLWRGGPAGPSAAPDWEREAPGDRTEWFGDRVAAAGDVNGDGYGDVLVSASGLGLVSEWGDEGGAWLHLGGPAGLSDVAARTFLGSTPGVSLGVGLAALGDVDGDGYGDVAIGIGRIDGTGAVEVYRGGPDGPVGPPAWSALGVQELAPAADVDGDGRPDLAASSPAATVDGVYGVGEVRVFFAR